MDPRGLCVEFDGRRAVFNRHEGPSAQHTIAGFSVDTPARAAMAARQGVQATILYGSAPAERSALSIALRRYGIGIIDGGISSELQYWECHRTHTVKPPPNGSNDYCRTDENPRVRSEAVVLYDVGELLARDARRSDVAGFSVLDDWPYWDPGSGRRLLQKIHALIVKAGAGKPAVCGFGAGLARGRVALPGIREPRATILTMAATRSAGTSTRRSESVIHRTEINSTGR